MTTEAPSATSAATMARPMPLDPPVTTATLPSKRTCGTRPPVVQWQLLSIVDYVDYRRHSGSSTRPTRVRPTRVRPTELRPTEARARGRTVGMTIFTGVGVALVTVRDARDTPDPGATGDL